MKVAGLTISPSPTRIDGPGSFIFERDTFAYPNELFWEYHFDARTQKTATVRRQPAPQYAHRCFVMVRTVRQFLYHARFDPLLPTVTESHYESLIRQVISHRPWQPSSQATRVILPGYDGLRSFSLVHAPLLKAICGGAWQSYFLPSHWRIVFPYSRGHQQRLANQLIHSVDTRGIPVVHLIRFPQLTINHGIILYQFKETDAAIEFTAYDPNLPEHPATLIFDRATRTFYFPRNHYWSGGRVDVMEVYGRRFF
jgi:hypothetical protein